MPNGIFTISTEFRLKGLLVDGVRIAIIFTQEMFEHSVIKAIGLQAGDAASSAASAPAFDLAHSLIEAIQKGIQIPSVSLDHAGFHRTLLSIVAHKSA